MDINGHGKSWKMHMKSSWKVIQYTVRI